MGGGPGLFRQGRNGGVRGVFASGRDANSCAAPGSIVAAPHSACPHRQRISILLPMPSQWSLQYFLFSGARQVQAIFAHFLG